jgi:RNA polymerase sigma-70 factor (ECF subfamily)
MYESPRLLPLDADDISRLYRRHARALVTFFARRTYDSQIAVELTAETFATAVADRASFRGSGDDVATAWLFGIARHQLSGWFRHARVEREALGRLGVQAPGLSDGEIERIDELAGMAQLRADVAASLDELSEEHRAALRSRIVEERGYEEVAAQLGVSEQVARARVSRGVRALKAKVVICEEVDA